MSYSVSIIQLTDKVNHSSTSLAIESFKRSYKDGKVVVINTQHEPRINEFSDLYGCTVILPSCKLNYPKFTYNQSDEILYWTAEAFFKPVLHVETDYFSWTDPDCFIVKPTDFNLYNDADMICCSKFDGFVDIFWLFLPIWEKISSDSSKRDKIMREYFIELNEICNEIGKNFDKISQNDLRHNFSMGNYIKTKKVQDLFFNKKDEIKFITKKFMDLTLRYVKKHNNLLSEKLYISPDYLLSFLFGIYEFKCVPNQKYRMINSKFRYDVNIFSKDIEDEILHPVKTYYIDKNQSFEKIVGNSL